ncbi:hypothetical protein SATMO3_18580 [Sporomusa aerivorans]
MMKDQGFEFIIISARMIKRLPPPPDVSIANFQYISFS